MTSTNFRSLTAILTIGQTLTLLEACTSLVETVGKKQLHVQLETLASSLVKQEPVLPPVDILHQHPLEGLLQLALDTMTVMV